MELNKPVDTGKTEIGNLDGHIAAVLCYIFMWTGFIWFFGEKKNDFVRFHALQSLLLGAVYAVFIILYAILSAVTCGFGAFILWIIFILPFVFQIIGIVKSVKKVYYKMPVIGNMTEKWYVQKPATPPTPPPAA